MTQAGLKEDKATNMAEWRKKIIQMTGHARDEEEHWGTCKKNQRKKIGSW